MPNFAVIRSMGSAFSMGSLRVVILKPCWVIEVPASAAARDTLFRPARPSTGIIELFLDFFSSEYKRNPALVLKVELYPYK